MESIRQIAFSAELLCLHYMPYASPLFSLRLPNELIQTHSIPHTYRNILCSVATFAGPSNAKRSTLWGSPTKSCDRRGTEYARPEAGEVYFISYRSSHMFFFTSTVCMISCLAFTRSGRLVVCSCVVARHPCLAHEDDAASDMMQRLTRISSLTEGVAMLLYQMGRRTQVSCNNRSYQEIRGLALLVIMKNQQNRTGPWMWT